MRRTGIKLPRYKGTWKVADEKRRPYGMIYLLKSEQLGQESMGFIVDKDLDILQMTQASSLDDSPLGSA